MFSLSLLVSLCFRLPPPIPAPIRLPCIFTLRLTCSPQPPPVGPHHLALAPLLPPCPRSSCARYTLPPAPMNIARPCPRACPRRVQAVRLLAGRRECMDALRPADFGVPPYPLNAPLLPLLSPSLVLSLSCFRSRSHSGLHTRRESRRPPLWSPRFSRAFAGRKESGWILCRNSVALLAIWPKAMPFISLSSSTTEAARWRKEVIRCEFLARLLCGMITHSFVQMRRRKRTA